jgi:hypothetical protein
MDWTVQTILLIQIVTLGLFVLPKNSTWFRVPIRVWILFLLFISCLAISAMLFLYSDSSLNLYY